MKKTNLLMFFSCILCNVSIMSAQTNQEKLPLWITMMENPKANYYEAVNEFNNYWKNKEKPNEEEEVFKEKKVKKVRAIKYAFEYKKFLQWKSKMFPFIKDDGTIASPEERKVIWEEENKNRLTDK